MPILRSSKSSTSGSWKSRGLRTSVGGTPSSLPQANRCTPTRTSALGRRASTYPSLTSELGVKVWELGEGPREAGGAAPEGPAEETVQLEVGAQPALGLDVEVEVQERLGGLVRSVPGVDDPSAVEVAAGGHFARRAGDVE